MSICQTVSDKFNFHFYVLRCLHFSLAFSKSLYHYISLELILYFIFAKKEALTCLEKSFSIKYPDIVSYNSSMTFSSADTFGFYYPEAAAAILYKAVKYNDQSVIDYILKTLSDENLVIRAVSPTEMLKLHNAVTNTQLNPAKYNFSDNLLQLNLHIISAQKDPELYFNYLSAACHEIADKLNCNRSMRKKLPIQDIQNYILSNQGFYGILCY